MIGRAPLMRRLTVRRLAFLDQAVISAANFATVIVLARSLQPTLFGQFTLAFAALVFANGIQSALITQPLNVFAATKTGAAFLRYTRGGAALQLCFIGLLAGVLGALWIVSRAVWPTWSWMFVALIPAAAAWQAQEFVRRVYYSEDRVGRAVCNDAVSYGGQAVILLALAVAGAVTVERALLVLAATSAAGVLMGVVDGGRRLMPLFSAVVTRESWVFGRWLLGANLGYWASTDLFVYFAAALAGAQAAGGFKAAQTLLGPLNVLLIFLSTILPIRFARLAAPKQRDRFNRELRKTVTATVTIVGVYAVFVAALSPELLGWLYGSAYVRYAPLVAVFGCFYVISAWSQILSAGLTAGGRTNAVFKGNVVGGAVALCIGLFATWKLGIYAAASGMVLSRLAVVAVLWTRLRREDVAHPPIADRHWLELASTSPTETGHERTAILISYHYLDSRSKAGFHWLAAALARAGWRVIFVTAPISWLSWYGNDHRFSNPIRAEANRLIEKAPGVYSYVLYSHVHPVNPRLPGVSGLTSWLCNGYPRVNLGQLEAEVEAADLVVFESTPALALYARLRALNERAKTVYRVSDDLRRLRVHPRICALEEALAPQFDLVSVASLALYERFAHLPNAEFREHGVAKELFDDDWPSPYSGPRNACFVGNSLLDEHFLRVVAGAHPEWSFHLLGDLEVGRMPDNVYRHGEVPFLATVPFIKHADLGLQTLRGDGPYGRTISSLKVLQYAYCGIPTLAPEFLPSGRSGVFYYRPEDDESALTAFRSAAEAQVVEDAPSRIASWDEVAEGILSAAGVAAAAQPDVLAARSASG